MKYKLLIVSADPTILSWKSLPAKRQAILNALNKTPNGEWELEIRQQAVTPKVTKGRVDHKWYDTFSRPLFREGNHFIYIHFSMKQWQDLGLDRSIRGANQIDTDFVGESYGRGDEHTLRGRTRENQFIQNVLHEMSHELARTTKVTDRTHLYHDRNPDISGIFGSYDMNLWHPVYKEKMGIIAGLQAKLASLLKKKFKEPFPQWSKPTQAYGVANSVWYPRTGIHIGTDFGTPVGTEIKAPMDGEITRVGNWPTSLGIWVEFKCGGKYILFCHLDLAMKKGIYKQEQVIAISGDTGFIRGIHTHVEGWHNPMDRNILNKENARQLTFDVTKHKW